MSFPNQVLSCWNCKNNQNLKLETNEAGTFIVCRSCGCRTRLIRPEDEEKSLYFSRYTTGVNELRNLRFDLAAESFREAYGMDHDEPDALWGLVCAEYGIVQVMSYHDQKYSPVFCLVNYRERASFARNMHVLMLRKLIDRGCKDHDVFDAWLRDVEKQIQKILEATPGSHTWKWDVFIACKISETTETAPDADGKTPEHEEALRLYEELTGRGLRVFYSEKYFVDNMGKPDSDWQIMSALLNSRQMLLVCGGERNDEKLNTPWVRSEWMRWRSMQRQGVKREDSLIVYSISENTHSLPEGLYTGNTVYPPHRAKLLQTLERNCYTDDQYERDLRKGQELLSRSDFSEASRVFTHTAHMRPDRAEPHVYLFLCDLRVTRLSGLSEKHIESSPESNPHYCEAEARNNRASCELFHDLKDRIRFLRDQQKDGEMARMREKMEEMERQLQEKMKEPERQPREKAKEPERQPREKKKEPEHQPQEKSKEPPIPMPVEPVRYSQGLKFEELEDGTYAVKRIGTCKDTELVIPPTTPEGGKVTVIEENSFSGCSGLTSITIPGSVGKIGGYAFFKCSGLTSITIPNSVTAIGYSAFYKCSGLTSLTIPDSVDKIGGWAFFGCSGLTALTIPKSVEHLGRNPFSGCKNLHAITVDPSNKKYYSQDNCVIDRASGELIVGIQTSRIPNKVTTIGGRAFYGCSGLTSLDIPKSVDKIGEYAFGKCSGLTSIDIPNSVTTIEAYAFSECSGLTSITIPNSVTTIGGGAFWGCPNVKIYCEHPSMPPDWDEEWNPHNRPVIWNHKAEMSAPTAKISAEPVRYSQGLKFEKLEDGTYAVKRIGTCKDTELVIPPTTSKGERVTAIGESAFKWCDNLTSITIPNGVTTIGKEAFFACDGLTSIDIPESVENLVENPFLWCKNLHTITVDPSNKKYYSQDNCVIDRASGELIVGVQTSRIPNNVTAIGEDAFSGCSGLTSLDIPNKVTTIGGWAFFGCSGLTSITIPGSVDKIGGWAFCGCPNVKIYCEHPSMPPDWDEKWNPDDRPVVWNHKVEMSAPTAKISAEPVRYSQGLEFEKLKDGTYAVAGIGTCEDTELVIPPTTPEGGKVTVIEENSFSGCRDLTSITIPESVEHLGMNPFSQCENLQTITVDPSNKKYYSQDNCVIDRASGELIVGIQTSRIPNNVTAIGEDAFRECSGLTSLDIPNKVTTIGGGAFDGCSGLTSITIPNSVTTIGDWAFYGCSGLTSITIPESVENLGENSFSFCVSLRTIIVDPSNKKYYSQDNCVIDRASGELIVGIQTSRIPNNVTAIGGAAFFRCNGLTSITIPKSVEHLGRNPFLWCENLHTITVDPSNKKYYSQDNCVIDRASGELIVGIQTSRIPNNVTAIGRAAFLGCNGLTSITIPNSVENLVGNPFSLCENLHTITVDPSNKKYYSQDNCVIDRASGELIVGIQTSRIPNNVTAIGRAAFFGCSGLISIDIPNRVTTIGDWAFFGCSGLTSIDIPNSVTTIGDSAFDGCNYLTSITIPDSVTATGDFAFRDCPNVKIYCEHPSMSPDWDEKWNPDDRPVVWNHKAETVMPATKTSTEIDDLLCGVKVFKELIFHPKEDGTYGVGTCAGDDNYPYRYRKLVIPPVLEGRRVTDISEYGFGGYSNLTSITIPNSVTTIGDGAFNECSGLTSITIPNSVTTIGHWAFYGCSGLTSITIPNSVTTIGEGAFYGCSGLTSLDISNKVTTIGKQAFSRCSGLTSITIPKSVDKIGDGAFCGCPNVKIYCEHPSMPPEWDEKWNPDNRPVVWNHKPKAWIFRHRPG